MSKEQITELLDFVKKYLSTRKGLVYVVHYAFAEQKEGEAFLHMPSNALLCTGNIDEAITTFFIMTAQTRNIAKQRTNQEISTAITGELLSSNLDVPKLCDRANEEAIPLLISMLETENKDAVATVMLQMTIPMSPVKTEEEPFVFESNGVVN